MTQIEIAACKLHRAPKRTSGANDAEGPYAGPDRTTAITEKTIRGAVARRLNGVPSPHLKPV
jgi:hypothetical protein